MDAIHNGWFSEINEQWPGQCMSLKVKEVLYHEKSKYQDIMVVKSETYGNVLILDGVIQITERDEFSYQEMITMLPVNSHPNPKKVLVIGGGDGGVIRELDRHPLVKEIVMCEIDEQVVNVAKKFLTYTCCGFDSPKLTLLFDDGCEYMKNHKAEFDVIITDSSDPVGPAEVLFTQNYFKLMKEALTPEGVLSTQGENMWLHLDLIKEIQTFCKDVFPVVDYGQCSIPTYPSGGIGFILCSNNKETNFRVPCREYTEDEVDEMKWRYYNSDVHRASFVLPHSIAKKLKCK